MSRRENRVSITHFLNGVGVALEGLETIAERRCRKYHLSLFRHSELGKVLVLDGDIQHVEAWSALYHETLVHLAASFVPVVKSVAILGGGSLFAALEVLKYTSAQRVLMFDHDPFVLETMAEFYPHARACMLDDRLEIQNRDAYLALERHQGEFDLVVNDAADLLTIDRNKTGRGAFAKMARSLTTKGACADVIHRHVFEQRHVRRTIRKLRTFRSAFSLIFIPEYHGVLHLLSIWGKQTCLISQTAKNPINREQRKWLSVPSSSPCVYFDPRFISYYLYLPPYFRKATRLRGKVV